MSILIDDGSRVLVQGITGREGQFHTERMIRYGTRVVGGVTPGRGGQPTLGVPVFDSVRQAVRGTGADVSVAFVPAALAADAACEASEAGIRLVVVIAEHVPVLDMVRVKAFFRERGTLLVGPNCPGIISPGKCKVGIMPGYIHRPGGVGLVSRSGTLTYEALVDFWSQFSPYAMNTLVVGDAMARILKLPEMQDGTAGLTFQGTGQLVTPMGATLLRSSAVPSGTILGLDRNYALEMVRASDVLVEYDKLIDRQLERAAVTSIAGFAKIFTPAAKVLQIGTAPAEPEEP